MCFAAFSPSFRILKFSAVLLNMSVYGYTYRFGVWDNGDFEFALAFDDAAFAVRR